LSAFNPAAPKDQYQRLQFGTQWQIQAGINASQLIFDGSYIIGLKAAKELTSLYSQLYVKSEFDAEINVTKAYFQVLTLNENINLISVNSERIQKLYIEMKAMNTQGFVEAIDVDKLELALSNLDIQKKNLENLYDISLQALKLQMGMDVKTPIELTNNLESLYKLEAEDLMGIDFNVSNRYEYKLLKQQESLNVLDKKRYQMGWIPNLVFFGGYNLSLNRNNDNLFKNYPQLPWVPVTLIGLKTSVPIFDGFMKKAKVDQINISQMKLKNDMFNVTNAFSLEYSAARSKYQMATQMIVQQKKNMELAQKILDVTQKKYKEGLSNSTDLQAAETDLKSSQTNYLNAIYDLLTAKTDLKKAIGKK
jgi:outer membrane protein TolC